MSDFDDNIHPLSDDEIFGIMDEAVTVICPDRDSRLAWKKNRNMKFKQAHKDWDW